MTSAICSSTTCDFEEHGRSGDRYCPWCAHDLIVQEVDQITQMLDTPSKPAALPRTDSHLIKPELSRHYPMVAYGRGVFLYDDQNRRFLDGCSGAISANIGHGVPEIARAMQEQAEQVAFVYRTQFTNKPSELLAERLAVLAPGDLDRVFFVNSGSEATETALRLAVQYWRDSGRPEKTRVISRQMSYHGMTLGALSMSGHPARRAGYEPILHPFPAVAPAYCYRCPLSLHPDSCRVACAAEWERAFDQLDVDTVAAVIVEPVVGAAGGAVPAPPGYLRTLREICDRHDVLLIADEVMTGLGRTGAWFACEHDGVTPDLLVLGKGLSAGYTPMSAVIARGHIIETLARGSGVGCFGHTYSANPLSASVCLAVLEYLQKHDLVAAARERGAQLRRGLEALARRHAIIGDVRGRGLLLGLELVADRATRARFPEATHASSRLVEHAFAHGLLIYPAGSPPAGDCVLVAPPLTITASEIDTLLSLLDAALSDLERQLASAAIQSEGN